MFVLVVAVVLLVVVVVVVVVVLVVVLLVVVVVVAVVVAVVVVAVWTVQYYARRASVVHAACENAESCACENAESCSSSSSGSARMLSSLQGVLVWLDPPDNQPPAHRLLVSQLLQTQIFLLTCASTLIVSESREHDMQSIQSHKKSV